MSRAVHNDSDQPVAGEADAKSDLRLLQDFENSTEAGFQMATIQGPLCSEPVVGMGWVVEKIEFHRDEAADQSGRLSAIVGALISSVRDACRSGMLDWSPRIKLAMYTCDIQASTDVLGKVYGVVARRRGRIVSEEMKEGTAFFTIRAMLPVVESFGFADGKSSATSSRSLRIYQGFRNRFDVTKGRKAVADLGHRRRDP